MSITSVAEFYCQLCKQSNERVIVEVQTLLEKDPSVLDLKLVYVPQKHFKYIVQVIKLRPEIESILLDNCSLNSDDLTLLFEAIREKKIVSISLKNVHMSAIDGEQLKELCKINPHIIAVHLEGTFLPEQLAETIGIAVQLNKSLEDQRKIKRASLIKASRKNIVSSTYYWPCSYLKGNPLAAVRMKSQAFSQLMKEIVMTEDQRFFDQSFDVEPTWFEARFPNLTWRRAYTIANTSETVCLGNVPVVVPEKWNNENLCNVLNLLQAGSDLVSSVLSRDLKDVSCFGFKFFLNGTIVEVIVDDYVPVLEKNGEFCMVGLHSSSRDFWGSLVEKAIAKLFGGYSVLDKLTLTDYILLLTGGLCFFKTSRDVLSFGVHDTFHALRQMTRKYRRFFCMAVPENSLAHLALIEKRIRPRFPYTVVSTDISKENGVTEYLVQLIGPPSMSHFSEGYNSGNYMNTEYLGFPHFWMRFDQFFVYFNKFFFILWRHLEHKGTLWSTVQESNAAVLWDVKSPLFAENPAFVLKCTDDSSSFLFLSIECSEEHAHVPKQLHFYPLNDGTRRYDISSKNEIDCSERITDTIGGVLVEMAPGEHLQVVPSAENSCSCVIKALSLRSFSLSSLPSSRHCNYVKGKWDFFRLGTRISSLKHIFKNISLIDQQTFIFSISQEVGDHGPFGVSLLIWVTQTPEQVNVFKNPDIETDIIRDKLAVFRVETSLSRGSFLVVVPCRHDRECSSNFCLAVYSEDRMSLDSRMCTAFGCSMSGTKHVL